MLTSNAIAWAHFQLRGGWNRALIYAGVYFAAIVALIGLTTKTPQAFGRNAMDGWPAILMAIQAGLLLLFASSRINGAVRGDAASRMIESHRLMPIHAGEAVLGFILGPSGLPLMIFGVNLLIGAFCSNAALLGMDRWFIGNAILIVFAMFAWSIVALAALNSKKQKGGIGWIIAIMFGGLSTQGLLLVGLPALSVMMSPLIGGTIFDLRASSNDLTLAYTLSLGGQVAIGSLCFIGAARKYRDSDRLAFTPVMALVLLASWVATSMLGIAMWREFQPGFLRAFIRRDSGVAVTQIIGAIGSSMLIAHLAIVNSSRTDIEWRRRREIKDPALGVRPVPPLLAAMLASVICVCALFTMPDGVAAQRSALSRLLKLEPGYAIVTEVAIAVFSYLLTVCALVRILHMYRFFRTAGFLSCLMVLLWIGPFIAEIFRHTASMQIDDVFLQAASTYGPLGTLVHVFADGRADRTAGLVAQVVLAIALWITFYLLSARNARRVVAAI